MELQDERFMMARRLNLSPHHPESWPIEILDRLIELEKSEGRQALLKELILMTTPPC